MTLRPLAAAVALTSALALSACSSDDPDPVVADPTPSAPASIGEATPSADTTVDAWAEESPEGAMAFAQLWLDTFTDAARSGDTTALRSISSRGCATCADFADAIDHRYSHGGSIEMDDWVLTRVTWSQTPEQNFAVNWTMRVPEQRFVDARGIVETAAALRAKYTFQMRWQRDPWQVTAVTTEGAS
ncbi:DUF6318 family protein [Nocardioides bruguierae]|uniref:DUF6318 family protein n=1 Tax=Nocardioides bruguierae TaxID=2945102 RepID=A0A9X2DB35_9ACTN|nr:DUF6318 family protein [Nocardioides bruguierae]MCM0622676.1 DUF6318 family protein [Nocardioides bruguierae]